MSKNRKLTPLAILLVCMQLLSPLELRGQSPTALVKPPAQGPGPTLRPFDLSLPADLGNIREYGPRTGPTIIHILTAHGNYDAQKKIHAILQHLDHEREIKTLLLEGSATALDPERLRLFSNRTDLTRRALEALAGQSLIKAPELFLADHPKVQAYGIENLEAYKSNRQSFKEVLSRTQNSDAWFKALDLEIRKLAGSCLNPALRKFVKDKELYDSGLLPPAGWLDLLRTEAKRTLRVDLGSAEAQKDWPMLVRFYKLEKFQKRFDAQNWLDERKTFLQSIAIPAGSFVPALKAMFAERTKALSADPETGLFFERLVEALPGDLDLGPYPQTRYWIGQRIFQSELREEDLLKEIACLYEKILGSKVRSALEKEWLDLWERSLLLKKLFRLELNKEEYRKVLGGEAALAPSAMARQIGRTQGDKIPAPSGKLDEIFEKALRFYHEAELRDPWMIQNTVRQIREKKLDEAVMITGGFHETSFREYFQNHGFRYIVITPRVSADPKGAGRNLYISNILGGAQLFVKATLEDFFLSDPLADRMESSPFYQVYLKKVAAILMHFLKEQPLDPSERRLLLDTVMEKLRAGTPLAGAPRKNRAARILPNVRRSESRTEGNLLEDPTFIQSCRTTLGVLEMTLDREGRIQSMNKAAQDLTGYSGAEVTGKKVQDLLMLPGNEWRSARIWFGKFVGELKEDSSPKQNEYYWQSKDKSVHEIRWTYGTAQNPEGGPERIVARGIEIKKRRDSEGTFQMLLALMKESKDALWVLDPKSAKLLDANDRAAQEFGFTREEFLDLNFENLLADSAGLSWEGITRDIRTRGSFLIKEMHYRVKGAGTRVAQIKIQAVRMDNGEEYFVAVLHDITQRNQLEILIEAGREINSVRNIPDIMRTLVAFARESVGSLGGTWGVLEEGDKPENNSMVFGGYNMQGMEFSIHYIFPRQLGIPGWVMQNLRPLVGNDAATDPLVIPAIREILELQNYAEVPIISRQTGKQLGCFEVHNKMSGNFTGEDVKILQGLADIAAVALDKTRAAEERDRAEGALRQRELTIQLSGGVAHDMNNLLVGPLAFPGLISNMLNTLLDDSQKRSEPGTNIGEYLNRIRRSAEALKEMAGALLSSAQMGHAKFTPVEITQILRDVIATNQERFKPHVRFEMALPEFSYVTGNSTQLMEVFSNLVVNASQAIPGDGKVSITEETVDLSEIPKDINPYAYPDTKKFRPGRYVKISIQDTGSGIRPEVLSKMFTPFFTTKVGAGRPKGTGLGLAVVQGLVESHQGLLNLKTAVGVGTTFEVYLPFTEKESETMKTDSLPIRGSETIWLIDDDASARKPLTIELGNLGYRVRDFENQEAAVTMARNGAVKPDLVVVDMVGEDGDPETGLRAYEALKRIVGPSLKGIMISGKVSGDAVKKGYKAGLADFLAKPFEIVQLAQSIRDQFKALPDQTALPPEPETATEFVSRKLPLKKQGSDFVPRILIIDDDASIAEMLEMLIQIPQPDAMVLKAHDREAIEMALNDAASLDLVFLDQNMPGVDPVEVAQKLNARREKPMIVVSSGEGVHADLQKETRHQLAKPYMMPQLQQVLTQAREREGITRSELRQTSFSPDAGSFSPALLRLLREKEGLREGVLPLRWQGQPFFERRLEEWRNMRGGQTKNGISGSGTEFLDLLRDRRQIIVPFVHIPDPEDVKAISQIFETTRFLVDINRNRANRVIFIVDKQKAVGGLRDRWDRFLRTHYSGDPRQQVDIRAHVDIFTASDPGISRFIPRSAQTVWLDWVQSERPAIEAPARARETQIHANELADGRVFAFDESSQGYAATLLQAASLLLRGPEESDLQKAARFPYYVQRTEAAIEKYSQLFLAAQEFSSAA